MKNSGLKHSHPLVDIVIQHTDRGKILDCARSVLENTDLPFNLHFGPVEDSSNLLLPRRLSRYQTPYLVLLTDQTIIRRNDWINRLFEDVERQSPYTFRTFDANGTTPDPFGDARPKVESSAIFVARRSPDSEENIKTIRSFWDTKFFELAPNPASWVDIAIANTNPTNAVLWETISAIHERTEHPYRIIAICGRRSLAANRNMALAVASSDYVCHFDDDLVVNDPQWMSLLMETLLKEDDLAIVGPKIVGKSGRIVRCGADRLARPIGNGRPSSAYTGVFEVHTMSSCMLMKRKVVPRFDIMFNTLDFEDIDHAYRVRRKGWRVMCDARVELTHLRPTARGSLWRWNHLYYHLKHPSTLIGLGRVRGEHVD
ncbi:MAG TPA: glycosyltransferase [bacterium]|jgi:glycosyltransferase involved in cell wall biosynthesis